MILKEIKKSIYSPEYYETIYHRPFSLSMRYFWALILLLSLVVTTFLSLIFVPHVYRFTTTIFDEAVKTYPAKLVLTIKDGEARSNVTEPYFISYPPRLKAALEATKMELPSRFVTIATRDKATLDQATRYQTLILVGRDGVVNAQGDPGKTTVGYATGTNFILNQATVVGWQEAYRPYLKFVPPVLVLFIFLFFLLVLAFNLIYLLIAAPFIMLLGRVMKFPLSYTQAYQYGLHAITTAILVDVIWLLVPGGLPWPVTLAIMLVVTVGAVYLNLREIQRPEA